MKAFFTILMLSTLAVSAQFQTDSVYRFGYRLEVPLTEPYQYMEYKTVNWADTGSSFAQYLDTVQHPVSIISLNKDLKPALTSKISVLDHEKRLISEFQNEKLLPDTLEVQLGLGTTYLAYDCNFEQDTVLFYWHADQIPTVVTLVCGDDGFHWPILLCKRRLSAKEIHDVYEAVKLREVPEVKKCGICYFGSEI